MSPGEMWFGAFGVTVFNFIWIAALIGVVWVVCRSITGRIKAFIHENSAKPRSAWDIQYEKEQKELKAVRERAKTFKIDEKVALERLRTLIHATGGSPALQAAFLEVGKTILSQPIDFTEPVEALDSLIIRHYESLFARDHVGERIEVMRAAYADFLKALPEVSPSQKGLALPRADNRLSWTKHNAVTKLALAILRLQADGMIAAINKVVEGQQPAAEWVCVRALVEALQEGPVTIPDTTRFQGAFMLGAAGSGKTTLIQYLAMRNVQEGACTIVIDSQGELIPQLATIKNLDAPILLVEPGSVAINPFTIKGEQGIDLIVFILGALGGEGSELTSRQMSFSRPCIRLLQEVPRATFKDFYRLLSKGGLDRYRQHLPKLSDAVQLFFENEFDTKNGNDVKQELFWRLRPIIEDPVYERMFCSREHRFDFDQLLDEHFLVLIDTDKANLQPMRSALLGRIFVAFLYRAALQRKGERAKPAYVYVDEAHEYLQDDQIAQMLDEVRKRKVALFLAMQRLNQIKSPNMLSAMLSTAVKLARPGNDSDAHSLAREMRIDAETLLHLPPRSFALFVRDTTPTGVTIKSPHFDIRQAFEHYADPSIARDLTRDMFGIREEPDPEPEPEPATEEPKQSAKVDTSSGEW